MFPYHYPASPTVHDKMVRTLLAPTGGLGGGCKDRGVTARGTLFWMGEEEAPAPGAALWVGEGLRWAGQDCWVSPVPPSPPWTPPYIPQCPACHRWGCSPGDGVRPARSLHLSPPRFLTFWLPLLLGPQLHFFPLEHGAGVGGDQQVSPPPVCSPIPQGRSSHCRREKLKLS